jgi:hypothetical protein
MFLAFQAPSGLGNFHYGFNGGDISMKRLLALAVLVLAPAVSHAADNVGTCGWGSKLMEGNKGIAPQVLAVTTNGTSGNQTFGISSGTSGCTQDGVVRSNWKTAMFVDANKSKLALDSSRGEGESLEALASLIGIEKADRGAFFSLAKTSLTGIFSDSTASTEQVMNGLRLAFSSSPLLSKYSSQI